MTTNQTNTQQTAQEGYSISELSECLSRNTDVLLSNVLPLTINSILMQACISDWPGLLADALLWIAVHETFEPGRFLGETATKIIDVIPEAWRLFEEHEARNAELAELIKALPIDDQLRLKNAMGI